MGVSSPFAIQLLAKIGAPLAAAVEADPNVTDDAKAAENMAKMLGLAVEMSIALHGKLDVNEDEKQADDTRTALAAIAAELIADFYRSTQKLPEENDKNRMIKSLESVLAFSDKFSSAQDQASRLKTVGHNQVIFDTTQSQLVVLQSMGHIINAVLEFPFGQNENKLIHDIAESIQKDAFNLAKENGTSDKLSELMIFKSLANLYAQCHRAETKKISGADQDGAPSLDPVWKAYETRVAMMDALVSGGGEESAGNAENVAPEPVTETTDAPTPAPEPEKPAEAPAAAPSGGPMGFFAKKPAGEAPATPAEPPQTETPPPSEETPIDNPIDMAEDATLPKEDAAEPPPEPEKPVEETPKGESGNPMSFFKSPPKQEGEE